MAGSPLPRASGSIMRKPTLSRRRKGPFNQARNPDLEANDGARMEICEGIGSGYQLVTSPTIGATDGIAVPHRRTERGGSHAPARDTRAWRGAFREDAF